METAVFMPRLCRDGTGGSKCEPLPARDTETAIDHDVYFQTLTLLGDYAAELDRIPPPPSLRPLTNGNTNR